MVGGVENRENRRYTILQVDGNIYWGVVKRCPISKQSTESCRRKSQVMTAGGEVGPLLILRGAEGASSVKQKH